MVRKYTRKRNIKRKRKFKKSKRNKKRGGRRSKKRRKKYSRKRNIKRNFRGGVKTGYKEEKVETEKKIETKEQLPKEKYGNELWQKKKEEPKNDADEIKYKKKWGFKWKDRNKYTSLPEGPLFYGYESKIHLDPSIIRTGNMSQLEATKKQTEERVRLKMEDKMKKKKKLVKKNEKGDIRHVLFEHCLQNLDNIPPHLIHPFQKYMVDLILTRDNATELKDLFWLLNYRIDKKTYGFDEGDGHKWHEMEKVFIPTDGVPYLEWNNKEDADNNIKLLKGVFGIIRKNCKLFWKTIWKDKKGSPIWTSEWRGLLERFKGIKSYLPKNKRATLLEKLKKKPVPKKKKVCITSLLSKPEGGTDNFGSGGDKPKKSDDDEVPAWWGWGNDGPPDSSADESDSNED